MLYPRSFPHPALPQHSLTMGHMQAQQRPRDMVRHSHLMSRTESHPLRQVQIQLPSHIPIHLDPQSWPVCRHTQLPTHIQ